MLCPDMSTDTFLLQLAHFMAIRGPTQYIYCDMGSNLTSASEKLQDCQVGERPDLNWKKVRERTASSGIKWTHCPAQAQWRDGRSEAMVKSLKRTLHHLNTKGDFSYSETACLLARAADVINNRPLGLRHHGSGSPDLCVITPNLLLQGSRTCIAETHGNDFAKDMANLSLRLEFVEKSFEEWWKLWISAVWPSLVPYKRWRTDERNVRPEDIVLVWYNKTYSKPEFRRGVVLRVMPDDKGRVRTVVVGVRPRHKADRGKPYQSKRLDELTLPVQRISVLLAAEERQKLPPANDDLHVCEEDTRVTSVSLEQGQVMPNPAEDTITTAQDIPVGEAARLVANTFQLDDNPGHCPPCVIMDIVGQATDYQESEGHGERDGRTSCTPSSPPQ